MAKDNMHARWLYLVVGHHCSRWVLELGVVYLLFILTVIMTYDFSEAVQVQPTYNAVAVDPIQSMVL